MCCDCGKDYVARLEDFDIRHTSSHETNSISSDFDDGRALCKWKQQVEFYLACESSRSGHNQLLNFFRCIRNLGGKSGSPAPISSNRSCSSSISSLLTRNWKLMTNKLFIELENLEHDFK